MELLLFFVLGITVGFYERDVQEKIKKLHEHIKKTPEPKIGATIASYGTVNPYAANQTKIGISEPKTPQQLEWEEQMALEEAQLHVKVRAR